MKQGHIHVDGVSCVMLDGGRKDVGGAGSQSAGDGQRGFHSGGVAVEAAVRRVHQPAAAQLGRLL